MSISMYRLEEMCRQHNAEGVERQRVIACHAGAVLRHLGMTADETARYQARIAGIEDRLAAKVAEMRKPPRLFR
jgi:hypothetical protein